MTRLGSGMKKKPNSDSMTIDREPTGVKSEREDFGIIPEFGVYTTINPRRSEYLLVASKGTVLDPPRARPYKGTDSSEGDMDWDENLDSGLVMDPEEEADTNMVQSEEMEQIETGEEPTMDEVGEGQEDDMVDETPQPLATKKAKKRPTIRTPDILRPKNPMHSPINPSPLRFMSKFSPDSPEAAPIVPLRGSAMERDDEYALPAYTLPIYSFTPGSLALVKPTRALMLAMERARALSVHILPDYPLGQRLSAKRLRRLRGKGLVPPGRAPSSLRGVAGWSKRTNDSASSTSAGAAKNSSSTSSGVPPLRLPPTPSTKPSVMQEPLVDSSTPLSTQKQSRLQPAPSPHTRTNEWASAGLQKPQIQPASAPSTVPATTGFNWGAAGSKLPSRPNGSWSCDVCMITNDAGKEQCAACESPRPAAAASASNSQPVAPVTSGFNWGAAGIKLPTRSTGSWSCDVCMITNDAAKDQCAACESPRPAATAPTTSASGPQPVAPATGGFNWGASGFKAPSNPTGSWSCGLCMVSNDATKDKCVCCETPRS